MRAGTLTRWISTALLMIVAGSFLAEDAAAIPAFARKYNFSCTTCHAPFPRLKDYGAEFAGNGFRLPEGEEPARAYRDTGDETLTLQRDLPAAIRLDAWATWEGSDADTDHLDLKTPWALKLLSGGSVAPNVGYYFYFFMSERGEVAGIEDAYLHFNDLGGIPLDLMIGQFQISDPMMKRELRLSFEDYEIYRVRVGDSFANLTYDRGVMATYDTDFGLGFVGEFVNGNGKGEADDDHRYDGDFGKGYAGRATYSQGPALIGSFYYTTEENIGGSATNEVEYYGADAVVGFGEVATFTAQYLRRSDSAPLIAGGMADVETDGLVAELVLQPQGPDANDAIVLLYNWIDSDLDSADYETWTASWSHLHRRNLRMVAELTYDTEAEDTRAVVGFSSAF